MRLNLLAGVANSAWAALVMLAVVPLYLKYLGIEAYGLIGFFATTQALLQLLDMGLAPTINREVARASASGTLSEAGGLLHTLAIIYWVVAGLIALGVFILAPVISYYWLQSNTLSQQSVTYAVMLIGLVVACRWPIGLYQGAVIGAHRLAVSSAINIIMVTIGSFGAVAVLALVSPSIEAFFIWQAVTGLTHACIIRVAAWKLIGRKKYLKFDIEHLKHVWRFSAGMSGVAISAIILMQLDKVLLSRLLTLEDFGRYMLAGLVASGLYVLLTPTFNVIYPRLSALIVSGDVAQLENLYCSGTRLLLSVIFPIAIYAAVFADDLVALWTLNTDLAAEVAPIVSLFLLGTALNGVMHFPYALQLAYGAARLPLIINTILVIVSVPLIFTLAMHYGAVGGAAAWALLNGIYVFIGTWLTHRSLLVGIGWRWVTCDVGIPLCLSLTLVGMVGAVFKGFGYPSLANFLTGGVLALLSFLLILNFSPGLSDTAKKIMLNRK